MHTQTSLHVQSRRVVFEAGEGAHAIAYDVKKRGVCGWPADATCPV